MLKILSFLSLVEGKFTTFIYLTFPLRSLLQSDNQVFVLRHHFHQHLGLLHEEEHHRDLDVIHPVPGHREQRRGGGGRALGVVHHYSAHSAQTLAQT